MAVILDTSSTADNALQLPSRGSMIIHGTFGFAETDVTQHGTIVGFDSGNFGPLRIRFDSANNTRLQWADGVTANSLTVDYYQNTTLKYLARWDTTLGCDMRLSLDDATPLLSESPTLPVLPTYANLTQGTNLPAGGFNLIRLLVHDDYVDYNDFDNGVWAPTTPPSLSDTYVAEINDTSIIPAVTVTL